MADKDEPGDEGAWTLDFAEDARQARAIRCGHYATGGGLATALVHAGPGPALAFCMCWAVAHLTEGRILPAALGYPLTAALWAVGAAILMMEV